MEINGEDVLAPSLKTGVKGHVPVTSAKMFEDLFVELPPLLKLMVLILPRH